MKKLFRITIVILLLLSVCFSSSCAKAPVVQPQEQTKEKNEAAITEVNEFDQRILDLPDKDYGGAKFRIATDTTSLLTSIGTTSVVGKQLYLRNRAIEEKYNVKLTLTEESGLPTITERIRTEALAGTDFCDLIVLELPQFQTLAAADLLVNVRTVPYLDFDSAGYHFNSLESTTIGSISYGFSGDAIFKPEDLFAVFFNKTLLSMTKLPDLYQMVEENQWDFDNFLLYAEEVYSLGRVNGNRVSGFASTENTENLIKVFWAASGQSFLNNDYGLRPSLIYDNETTTGFIKSLQSILYDSVAYFEDSSQAFSQFSSGSLMFLIAPICTAEKLTSSGVDYGIVPLPKQDINQSRFYSYQKSSFCFAGFTKGTADFIKSGLITNALFCASVELSQSLCTTTYANLYLGSREDVLMLQKVFESPYYDAAEFFNQMDSSFSAATHTLIYRVISSEGQFQSLFLQYKKMLNKYLDKIF